MKLRMVSTYYDRSNSGCQDGNMISEGIKLGNLIL